MKLKDRIRFGWQEFRSVVRNEYKYIFKDEGIILVLVIALILYSTVYSYAYKNQVLRNIPIGVVDMDHSDASRSLSELFDAGASTFVAYNPESMEEAEDLFFARKIYGIVYIPEGYEKDVLGGITTHVGVYVDASYFLMYRNVFAEVVSGVNLTGVSIEFNRLVAGGVNTPTAEVVSQPVIFEAHSLFNPYLGYGTFVMPIIIMVIIQQTLLIGIGMIGGSWREFGLYRTLALPGRRRLSMMPIVLGKSLVYASIYAVTMTYILGFHYVIFDYPMNGRLTTIIAFLVPYVFACIFMGIAVSTLFRYRENSLLLMLWTSIPVLMLTGASFPGESIPHWLMLLGKIFPSSSGADGFIRIQTTGASFEEVLPQFKMLWALCVVYFFLACYGIRRVLCKEEALCEL